MSQVGIIGGVDEPTAIILASGLSANADIAIALLLAGIAVILLVSWLYDHHRKKQQ